MANEPELPVVVSSARKVDRSLVVVEHTPTGAMTYPCLTPEGLKVVTEYSAKGYTHASVAARLGISHKAWIAIRERSPDAFDAFEEGRAQHDSRLKDVVNKHVDQDSLTAAIVGLKLIHGYREVGPADSNNSAGPTINITFNQPSSLQDVTNMIGPIPSLPDEDAT